MLGKYPLDKLILIVFDQMKKNIVTENNFILITCLIDWLVLLKRFKEKNSRDYIWQAMKLKSQSVEKCMDNDR